MLYIFAYIYIYICISIYIYIYIYQYIYIQFIEKKHFFVKNICHCLHKLCEYDNNQTKHQTKINIAINTNELKLKKKWNFKISKSIVYY